MLPRKLHIIPQFRLAAPMPKEKLRMSNKLTIPYRMRWWGWGVDGNDKPITTASEKLLQREIGMSLDANNPPRNIADVTIPNSRLSAEDI